MSEYRKAKPEEREACIEFADYVFSKAHCPHDFETLIPRVYGEGVDSASMHRIAVDERGKIRALIAVCGKSLKWAAKRCRQALWEPFQYIRRRGAKAI